MLRLPAPEYPFSGRLASLPAEAVYVGAAWYEYPAGGRGPESAAPGPRDESPWDDSLDPEEDGLAS